MENEDLSLEIARKSIELGRNIGKMESKIENKRTQGELNDLTKNQAYDKGFITAMKLYARPQGEWIKQHGKSYMLVTDEGNFVGEFTKCPKCLYDKARGSNFCPNCGAKMRGAK